MMRHTAPLVIKELITVDWPQIYLAVESIGSSSLAIYNNTQIHYCNLHDYCMTGSIFLVMTSRMGIKAVTTMP